MPCHGDKGQGLTDEWREVWVEDHQNCWGRNCHTGNSEMAAFYIPKQVPAVAGAPGTLSGFATARSLYTYLQATQPPQRAGALAPEEYWSLTAFLLHENRRLPTRAHLSDWSARGSAPQKGLAANAMLGMVLILVGTSWPKRPNNVEPQNTGH
jgi:hypothetical protein